MTLGSALFALALVTSAHAQPAAEPSSDDPVTDQADSADHGDQVEDEERPAAPVEATPIAGPSAIDMVLPTGVRVLIARDSTLPVASVVLAIETGTEDDPDERPGLVHALAYHLLQGNRELPPEGVARIAHDGGGVTSMAVGPAQIRFESLVPLSLLDDMVRAESQRLRSPTVDETLWNDSLGWARRDARRNRALAPEALAALHDAEGLARAGRSASPELRNITPPAVARALSERMSYTRTTLVVVSPLEPSKVLERVREHFADLPAHSRQVDDRFSPTRAQDGPRPFEQPEANGSTVAWPVPPGTEELERARVLCRVLNRQRRDGSEPARARVRCHLDEDPRRGALIVRVSGTDDPLALVRARMHRIVEGEDDRLLEQQARVVARALALELSTPLGLARRLATSDPRPEQASRAPSERPLEQLTGLRSTADVSAQREAIAERYPLEAALHIVPARAP